MKGKIQKTEEKEGEMKKKPNKRILLFFGLFMMILLSGYFLWKQKGSESKEGIDHFLQNLKASKETDAKMDEVYATSHTDFVLEETIRRWATTWSASFLFWAPAISV